MKKNIVIILLAMFVLCFVVRAIYNAGFYEGYRLGQLKAVYDSIK
jgi:hypothetical protein